MPFLDTRLNLPGSIYGRLAQLLVVAWSLSCHAQHDDELPPPEANQD